MDNRLMIRYTCPVCFFPDLEDPPKDYNICPCCGIEFGYEDANRTHEELRQNWIECGMKWWSTVSEDRIPKNWNPEEQLKRGYEQTLSRTPGKDEVTELSGTKD